MPNSPLFSWLINIIFLFLLHIRTLPSVDPSSIYIILYWSYSISWFNTLSKQLLRKSSTYYTSIITLNFIHLSYLFIRVFSLYNKFVNKKNSLQTYSLGVRQKDSSKHPFSRFFFNNAGSSFFCLLANKLLYSHDPRCYKNLHKNCSYGHCFIKLMLLPGKLAALILWLDIYLNFSPYPANNK